MNNYEETLKQIGMKFRLERTKQRLSQEKFAEMASVHTNYIGKIERGEQNLTVKKIVNLCNVLNIPTNNIFNLDNL